MLKMHNNVEKRSSVSEELSSSFNEDSNSGAGDQQLKCAQCWKSFEYANSLYLHLKNAHGVTIEGGIIEDTTNDRACNVLPEKDQDANALNAGRINKTTSCLYCDKEFSWERSLLQHKQKVHFFGPFRCPKCNLVNNFARDLIEHMTKKEHMSDSPVYCPSCQIGYSAVDIEDHYMKCIRMQPDERLAMAEIAMNQLNHVKENTAEEEVNLYTCPYCDESFKTVQPFSRHKKLQHFWGLFRCSTCEHREFFAADIVEHVQNAENHDEDTMIKCPSCKQNFDKSSIKSHYEECVHKKRRKELEKQHATHKSTQSVKKICEECGKVLTGSLSYKRHLKSHLRKAGVSEEEAGLKLYAYCEQCPKKFTNLTHLKNHVKRMHENTIEIEVLSCPICEKAFSSRTQLKMHNNEHHSTDEKFQCGHCGKRCASVHRLGLHMKSHEKAKFKCSYCGKLLKKQASLEAHEREHRGERPFE